MSDFGSAILPEFQLDPKLLHFNNGSFGTVPRAVRAARLLWLDQCESHPDLHLTGELDSALEASLAPIAKYVNASPEDLVFIANATQGINIVIRSFEWKQGDLILCYSTTYPGVRILLNFLVERCGVELFVIDHKPCSNEELVSLVKKDIAVIEAQGKKIKMSIVDAICSVPGLVMPYEEIAAVLKKHGSLVTIDGAHAFGQIPLRLGSTNADFLVTNLHKWGFCYRPTAILFAKPEVQNKLHLPIITYGYGSGSFKSTFAWPGTIDYSPWLSADAALNFRHDIGDQKIKDYLHDLAWKGGHLVAQLLGTSVLGDESQTAAMVNVSLPVTTHSEDFGKKIENHMLHNFNMRIKVYHYHGSWWIRISAMIFLDLKDFEKLAIALKDSIQDIQCSF